MAGKKTVFQDSWLAIPKFKTWLSSVPKNKFAAYCNVCNSTFQLSNMGKRAVSSHMNGSKHIKKLQGAVSTLNGNFYNKEASTSQMKETAPENPHSMSQVIQLQQSTNSQCTYNESSELMAVETGPSAGDKNRMMQTFLLKENVTKAEIIWCLQIVIEHMSFRSAERALSAFKMMCTDSEIAEKIQLHRTKIGYTIVHGIAPYFKRKLVEELQEAEYLVVGFDESLNKISQKQQMDIFIRYFDQKCKLVKSRYLTSVFLGHTTACDLLDAFKEALADLSLKKIIQVSMDGPNVNIKFMKDLRLELSSSPSDPVILDIGSCGIHTMHCAFKAAIKATKWDLASYLRSLYYLFKDVPARRADYVTYGGSSSFPKKFCGIRWGENSLVAKRAIEIHSNLLKYVAAVEKNGIAPNCQSFKNVKRFLNDPFLLSNLSFFQMIAEQVEPFLKEFQSEAPMAPFLYESLYSYVSLFVSKFVKKDVLNDIALTSIDLYKKSNLKHAKEVDLGYSVRANISKIKPADNELHKFNKSCLAAYQAFVDKILKRSPLKHKLTEAISCLDPHVISEKEIIAKKRLTVCLDIMLSNNWISGNGADKIDVAYRSIFDKSSIMNLMKSYNRQNRLDEFWIEIIRANNNLQELQKFVQFVLILSHGNAFVERGFSINSECILENQAEESLIALRQVHDFVTSTGGIATVEITKSLIHSVKNSYIYYREALENKKKLEILKNEQEKNKQLAKERVKELQKQKMKLQSETEKQMILIEEEIKSLK